MAERTQSPTRTKATWKPRIDEGDPSFMRVGDATAVVLDRGQAARFREPGRSPVAELPYQGASTPFPDTSTALPLLEGDAVPAGLSLAYRIVGGYDANAVEVSWSIPAALAEAAERPVRLVWVMLKTFTGLQVKYPLPGKRGPVVFALADEDAYVYCDEPVCKECTFRCKQGMVLYGAFEGAGIVRQPLSPNRR
ncbi:MAG: hypothetical protein UCH28_06145 [Adlercreutzia sp.]|nr:hypothetical protein [Adlercreutzia sp.]